MPSPFVSQNGVIRRSPLQQAVASSRAASNSNVTANRSSAKGSGVVNNSKPLGDPDNPTDQDIDNAQKLAEAGDQQAIDWLNVAGFVGGAAAGVVGGHYLNKALRDRAASKKGPTKIGADNISTAVQTGNESTAVAKKAKKGPDLYIDLPETEYKVRDGYLPPQPTKKIPKFTPSIAKDLGKAVRRLP